MDRQCALEELRGLVVLRQVEVRHAEDVEERRGDLVAREGRRQRQGLVSEVDPLLALAALHAHPRLLVEEPRHLGVSPRPVQVEPLVDPLRRRLQVPLLGEGLRGEAVEAGGALCVPRGHLPQELAVGVDGPAVLSDQGLEPREGLLGREAPRVVRRHRREGELVELDPLLVRVRASCARRGDEAVLDGALRVPPAREVVRQLLGVLGPVPTVEGLEGAADRVVEVGRLGGREEGEDGLADHAVGEAEPGDAVPHEPGHHVAPFERAEGVEDLLFGPRDASEEVEGDLAARAREHAEDASLLGAEPRQAGADQVPHAAARRGQARLVHVHGAPVDAHHAVLGEPLERLLDVEWIPAGRLHDAVQELRGDLGVAGHARDHRADVLGREARKAHLVHRGLAAEVLEGLRDRPPLDGVGRAGRDDEERRQDGRLGDDEEVLEGAEGRLVAGGGRLARLLPELLEVPGEVAQEVDGHLVGPLEVREGDDEGLLARGLDEELAELPDQADLVALGLDLAPPRGGRRGDQLGGDDRQLATEAIGERGFLRGARDDVAEDLDERPEGPLAVLGAADGDDLGLRELGVRAELREEAPLADPLLPGDDRDGARRRGALGGADGEDVLVQGAREARELVLAADERRGEEPARPLGLGLTLVPRPARGVERGDDLVRPGEAVVGVLLEEPQDDLLEGLRRVGTVAARRLGVAIQVLPHHGDVRVPLERKAPRDGLVEEHAERVEVGALVDAPPLEELGGHVVDGPLEPRLPLLHAGPRETEVEELDLPRPRHAQVGGLHVVVDEAPGVDVLEPPADLGGEVDEVGKVEARGRREELLAGDVFHRVEARAHGEPRGPRVPGVERGDHAEVVHLGEVRVAEVLECAELVLEEGDRVAGGGRGSEGLQGEEPVLLELVLGEEDHPGRSLTQLADEPVPAVDDDRQPRGRHALHSETLRSETCRGSRGWTKSWAW